TCAYETWTSAGATALDAARRAGDAAGSANIHVSLGHACMESGSFAAALRHGQAALAHATAAGWCEGTTWSLAVMGWAYGFIGETRAAVAALERAAHIARSNELRDPLPLLAATVHLGDARLYGGELAAAEAHYEDVLRHTTDDGDKLFRGLALLGLGTACRYAGALDRAMDHLESAIQQLDSISAQSGHAEALAMLSLAHHDAGRDLTARRIGERAVGSALERRESGKIPVALISLAATYERTGPATTAPDLYAQALAAARDANRPFQEIEALCGLARARLRSGQPDVALAHARTALDLGRDDEWLVQAGMIHTTLAQTYLAHEDTAAAVRHAHRAIEITDRAGARLCRAHALRVLGDALHESGGTAAAHQAWQEATGLYSAIGAPEAEDLARRMTRAC
ncbi:MAG: tetratricopeptide repeat protein, partial [Actinomadura sp.]